MHRLFDQRPLGRSPRAMMGHAIIHLTVQRLAGGNVGHSQGAVGGEFLGQAALAGTSAAEDQLEHSHDLLIDGVTTAIASRLAPTGDRQ
ncbi:hypothetical protein D3C73_1489790 [compost metagenome]